VEVIVVLLLIFGTIFLIGFVLQIFFLMTQSRALGLCQPHNRTMEPAQVWLNLIPLFNLVWMFITVSRVSETLKYEFRARRRHRHNDDYGYGLGIAMCISPLAGWLPFLILTIVYWVKMADYARRLEYDPGWYGDGAEDYDDRPRRRSRARDRDRDEDYDDRRDERPWDRGGR
jgi:hypothetical protein